MAGLVGSKRWQILEGDEGESRHLASELGITPLVARVLVARGITDADAARAFLSPSLERDWCDPLCIPGLREAADRLERAIGLGETVAVFGDFDVDGMSAATLLSLGLRQLGADVYAFIPDRFAEGYGLSDTALARVVDACHPDLIVTVDNGIAAAREVEGLLARGIDVVITDHHEPADLVPKGVPVCDPKLDPTCPSRELAGVGVALKIICELGLRLGMPDLWRSLTDLACLGTVSDMMLLQGENRALVADGIARMRTTTRPGIVALAATAGCDLSTITADALPFSLVPRLNAAGRMGKTDVAFRILLTDDVAEASTLAAELEQINTDRRAIEGELSDAAIAEAERIWHGERAVVVAGRGWHEGVKGIVASRLVSKYHVPAIVFSITEEGEARGSGRSVGSVDLFHAVEQCADLTIRFGGHEGAVGVTVAADRVDAFRERLQAALAELPAEQFESTGEVTALVDLGELSVDSINALEVLQPFGQGNKKPLFGVRGVTMRNRARAGAAGNHLRFVATDGLAQVPAIMFRVPDIDRAAAEDGVVDLVFEAVNETWQGRTKVKLMVKDILYRDGGEGKGEQAGQATLSKPVAGDGGLSHGVAPAELARLPYDQLTKTLVKCLIGDHDLLPAQAQALDLLARGRSTLVVMATGRGKSLIFHVHAAREALAHGRASVFVYPLRALVADQAHHLGDALEGVGVGVRTLTGETDADGRAATWAALADGSVSVVLTTPEFLAIHAGEFARNGRIGFVVIDEAHHVAEMHGRRTAYGDLPRILEQLGYPTALALTATADGPTAQAACRLLGIDQADVLVDATVRDNLELRDCRCLRDRDAALASLVARGEKCVVYVNSRDESVSLVRTLRHTVGDLADRIAYYNAGMPRDRRLLTERLFREGRLTCIVSTSAFGEGVNVGDVRHVVLYHLPFGRTEFNQMSGRCGRDGKPACVWLLFSAEDARINERVLAAASPSRDELVALYRALRASADGRGRVALSDKDLAGAACRFDRRCALDARGVACGIAVFAELGFLYTEGPADGRVIVLEPAPEHMQLEQSIRYAEGQQAWEAFSRFRQWALGSDPASLLAAINRPIVPGFGQTVAGE